MGRCVTWLRLTSGVLAVACSLFLCHACARAGTAERVSVSATGAQGNEWSCSPSMSPDGRFVAFYSAASNLVPGDTNGAHDVFVRDRTTGTTVRVSVSTGGYQGNADSRWPDISADGRFVAFESMATNLVPGDTNGSMDIFVHDALTGQTEAISIDELGSPGNGWSWKPTVSADGRFVAFASDATNLVPFDANGEESDIFVYDRQTGQMELASVNSSGTQGDGDSGHDWARAAISADGRCVAFVSDASNLVPGDTNGFRDAFVRDRETGLTERVNLSSEQDQADGPCDADDLIHGLVAISADGRFVALVSQACNLVPDDTNGVSDVFLRDRSTGTTSLVSVGRSERPTDASSWGASITADGRFIVFVSRAGNLVPPPVPECASVYLHDRWQGTTELISATPSGEPSIFDCMHPAVTADGHFVCFVSEATDVAGADTNDTWDVFVYDRLHTGSFSDIPCLYWASAEVGSCLNAGIVSGYPDGLYRPKWALTREQMAVYVSRALAGGDENVPEFTATPTFPDVPEGHWALDYVEYAVEQNVVAGYDDGNYHPEYEVTRDQMAVYVARSIATPTGEAGLEGYVPSDPRNFPDVPPTGYGDDGTEPFWAYTHIEYCVEHDVVGGYDDGLYHPEWVVTRDQMAVYIARAFELPM